MWKGAPRALGAKPLWPYLVGAKADWGDPFIPDRDPQGELVSSKRGSYSREFKETAVLEVIDQSRPIADVARQLELVEQTLGNWVKDYRAEHAGDTISTTRRSAR